MGRKLALVIGNSQYNDTGLSRLPTAQVDVRELADVLLETEIGQFDDVIQLADEGLATVRRSIAYFFNQARREDLLVLYFSGHGVKDEQGQLYLAVKDTERSVLSGTSIEAAFVTAQMDRSNSKRQVLILDCCHSGAFARGAKGASAEVVGVGPTFEGRGYGRVVLTATDATQYAWEDSDQMIGESENSVFTHYLLQGLKTGEADRDGDGLITVDELYDYVYDHVIRETPKQTPCRWSYQQKGDIVMAKNRHPPIKPVDLPPEVRGLVESPFVRLRTEAVPELVNIILSSQHRGVVLAARNALKALASDDSRRVSATAQEALTTLPATERMDSATQQRNEQAAREARERAEAERQKEQQAERERAEREQSHALEGAAREARERAEAERQKEQQTERERAEREQAHALEEAAREARERAEAERQKEEQAEREHLEREIAQAIEAARQARERAEAERKRKEHERNAQEVVDRARQMFAEGQHEAALEVLRGFEPPHDLVSTVREQLEQDLDRLRKEKEEAERQTLERRRRQKELERQARELERKVAALIEKAEKAESRELAIDVLRQVLRLSPDHAAAKQLLADQIAARDQEAAERTRQQKVASSHGEIADLLTRGELDKADRAITQAETDCQEVEAFEGLRQRLTDARQAEARRAEEEEARRVETERQAEAERQSRIEQASMRLIDAQAAVEARRFVDALEILRAVAELDPEAQGLAALREQAEAGKAAADHAERIRMEVTRLLSESSRYHKGMQHNKALKRVNAALEADPGNPSAVALREQIEAAIAESRRRQAMWERARELRNRVATLIEESTATSDHEAAIESLRAALELDPENTTAARHLQERTAAIERDARERERQQHIAAAQARIGDLLAADQLDEAGHALAHAERDCREIAGFEDLRRRLEEAVHTRLALAAVEAAREEFGTGARDSAVATLAQFSPPHAVVTRALEELRDEIKRILQEEARTRAEAKRRARRQRLQQLRQEVAEGARRQVRAIAMLAASISRSTIAVPGFGSVTLRLGLAVVLAVVLGTWAGIYYLRQEAAPSGRSVPTNPPNAAPTPSGAQARPGESPPAPDAGRAPSRPQETPAPAPLPSAARRARLAAIEREARGQLERGDRRALDTVASGLELEPGHAGLQGVLTEIAKRAEAEARRARADARRVGAFAVSSAPYQVAETWMNEGVRLQNQARLQNQSAQPGAAGRDPAELADMNAGARAAVRAFWAARDAYLQALKVGEQLTGGAGAAEPARPPVRNEETDRAAIRLLLDRYEAAYASLDVRKVSQLQPYLSQADLASIATAFRQHDEITIKISIVNIAFSNNRTVAHVSVRTQGVYDRKAGGRTDRTTTDTIMHLRKTNNVWGFTRQ